MKKNCLITFIAIICTSITLIAQNTISNTVNNKLSNYTTNNYPEKVYLHIDKPFYSPGDDLWFSAYLVNGITHKSSEKSALLYVEFINSKDSIISKRKIFIPEINAAGDFKIDKETKPGKYYIRAYTNYNRNQDSEYFFQKEITILPTKQGDLLPTFLKNAQIKSSSKTKKPILKFYPEGGYIIDNLKNNIAIKLEGSFFNDLKIPINIKDNNNNVITTFSSSKFGLGKFYLTPKPNVNYYASLEIEGKEYSYKLPQTLNTGYLINTVHARNNLLVNVQSNTLPKLFGATLVIHQRGQIIFNQTFKDAKNSIVLKVDKNNLKNGVVHITLFNSEGKPSAERLVYINNKNDNAALTIEKPKDYFGKRKKVTLNLNVKDISQQNIVSHLSMSVRDLTIFPQKHTIKNIKTWLLLNSDLRGKIKDPNYFFEKENDMRRSYLLDLVMLTHGWRRFKWQNLLYQQSSKKNSFEAEKGIMISGQTFDMNSPYGIKSVPTRLTFLKQMKQEPIQVSNAKGQFSYGPYIFFDSIPMLLEARATTFKSTRKENRFILISPKNTYSSPKIINNNFKAENNTLNIDAFYKHYNYLKEIDSTFKQQQNVLNEVVIKTNLNTKNEERRKEMNARTSYGSAFRRTDIENSIQTGNVNLLDVLQTINGVQVIGDEVFVRLLGNNSRPLILVDETPVDIEDLETIVQEVSFVDILNGPEASRFTSGGPVISIYTKSGSGVISNSKRKPGIIDFKANGFYTAREFFAPDHVNGIEEQTKADVRTTLHWQPTIKTSKTGNVTVSFFTSDSASTYLIEVEGITETGIPVHKTTKFIVE